MSTLPRRRHESLTEVDALVRGVHLDDDPRLVLHRHFGRSAGDGGAGGSRGRSVGIASQFA
jgi:hypothetical protein